MRRHAPMDIRKRLAGVHRGDSQENQSRDQKNHGGQTKQEILNNFNYLISPFISVCPRKENGFLDFSFFKASSGRALRETIANTARGDSSWLDDIENFLGFNPSKRAFKELDVSLFDLALNDSNLDPSHADVCLKDLRVKLFEADSDIYMQQFSRDAQAIPSLFASFKSESDKIDLVTALQTAYDSVPQEVKSLSAVVDKNFFSRLFTFEIDDEQARRAIEDLVHTLTQPRPPKPTLSFEDLSQELPSEQVESLKNYDIYRRIAPEKDDEDK